MSFDAMMTGVQGLRKDTFKIETHADNVANLNTYGYKKNEVQFSTLVTTPPAKNFYSSGGVLTTPRTEVYQQGGIEGTSITTDISIRGDGMFVVNTASGDPDDETQDGQRAVNVFTRAGSFRKDDKGYLQNAAGYYLQGWKLNSDGTFFNGEPIRTSFADLETVNITGINFTGTPSTQVKFAANLPSDATGFDPERDDNNKLYEPFITGLEFFDPLGSPKTMELIWTPTNVYGRWTLELRDPTLTAGNDIMASFDVVFDTAGDNAGTPTSITERGEELFAANVVGTSAPETVTFDLSAFTGGGNSIQANDVIRLNAFGQQIDHVVTAAEAASSTDLATGVAASITAAVPAATTAFASAVSAGAVVTITADPGTDILANRLVANDVYATRLTSSGNTPLTTDFTGYYDIDGEILDPLNPLGPPVTPQDPIIVGFDVQLQGGQTMPLTLDLGRLNTNDGIQQYSDERDAANNRPNDYTYTPTLIQRDGAQFGTVDRVEITEDGVLNAVFDNGQLRPLYRIPLVDFVNPNGLTAVDGNAWSINRNAGAYYLWNAGSGPTGTTFGSSLENSTVDLAEELTGMIITQRSYSANAKTITTNDEMLQILDNIKR